MPSIVGVGGGGGGLRIFSGNKHYTLLYLKKSSCFSLLFCNVISTQLLWLSEIGEFPWNWFLGIEPISLVWERKIHLWCVYVLYKMSAHRGNVMWPYVWCQKKCTKRCVCTCMCGLIVLPRKGIVFFILLLLLLQLPILI